MNRNFNNRALTVSQKIYERLLRAYPPAHRAEYGPAMAQLFRDQCRDAWDESRGWGVMKLWLRVLPDLVKTSIIERLAALTQRKSMSDKITNLIQPRAIFFRVFAAVFLITVLVSVAITYILPESYASTARIKVENDKLDAGYDPYFIQTQFEIMQSQVVLEPVIDKLNLNVQWGKKYLNGETLKSAESLQILKGRISLVPVRNTKLVAITVYSDDPKEAASLANTIAAAYQDYRIQHNKQITPKGIEVLRQQFLDESNEIRQVKSEADLLRQQFKIGSEVSVNPSSEEKLYWDKKHILDQMTEGHELFAGKIKELKLDAQIPRPAMVTITDTAEPGRAPVKPNKTVNIVLGVIGGIFLAAVAGGTAAFIALHFRKKTSKAAATV